jgi:hypothetical protein
MAEITLTLKRVFQKGLISFEVPQDEMLQTMLINVLSAIKSKHNDYAQVTIKTPRKPRTTGFKSQNHHLNGHIVQICNHTGNSYSAIKDYIKLRAVEELGYPYEIIKGKLIPKPESDSSTEECALLIEATHIVAAEEGIILREE